MRLHSGVCGYCGCNSPDRRDEAVRNLYYAAHWTPDRPVDSIKLWEDLRDAFGFTPGHAPKPFVPPATEKKPVNPALLSLAASMTLADHLGDVWSDMFEALKQEGLDLSEVHDVDSLHDKLAEMGVKTIWGTEISRHESE